MENYRFNKKIFALLLERAKGDRSWRQFAFDCDISYVQMRKLAQEQQENPPRPKLIKKISDHSFNEIDFEDLMFAAGIIRNESSFAVRDQKSDTDNIYSMYRNLTQKDKNLIKLNIEFLLGRSKKQEDDDKYQ